jgi:hypothetical protein
VSSVKDVQNAPPVGGFPCTLRHVARTPVGVGDGIEFPNGATGVGVQCIHVAGHADLITARIADEDLVIIRDRPPSDRSDLPRTPSGCL